MKLHRRRTVTIKAKNVLIDFIENSIFINELTYLEKIMVINPNCEEHKWHTCYDDEFLDYYEHE